MPTDIDILINKFIMQVYSILGSFIEMFDRTITATCFASRCIYLIGIRCNFAHIDLEPEKLVSEDC